MYFLTFLMIVQLIHLNENTCLFISVDEIDYQVQPSPVRCLLHSTIVLSSNDYYLKSLCFSLQLPHNVCQCFRVYSIFDQRYKQSECALVNPTIQKLRHLKQNQTCQMINITLHCLSSFIVVISVDHLLTCLGSVLLLLLPGKVFCHV